MAENRFLQTHAESGILKGTSNVVTYFVLQFPRAMHRGLDAGSMFRTDVSAASVPSSGSKANTRLPPGVVWSAEEKKDIHSTVFEKMNSGSI